MVFSAPPWRSFTSTKRSNTALSAKKSSHDRLPVYSDTVVDGAACEGVASPLRDTSPEVVSPKLSPLSPSSHGVVASSDNYLTERLDTLEVMLLDLQSAVDDRNTSCGGALVTDVQGNNHASSLIRAETSTCGCNFDDECGAGEVCQTGGCPRNDPLGKYAGHCTKQAQPKPNYITPFVRQPAMMSPINLLYKR